MLPSATMLLCGRCLFLILIIVNYVDSQSFIKTLPGFRGDLPFTLETGYVSVGEYDDGQMFYYFIHSESNPEEDPLLLWLTGGPGCSGFSGLVYEIGPLVFDYGNFIGDIPILKLNPYSWTKVANVIFIDAPVGTGFSYANNSEEYRISDSLSVQDCYNFLKKWLITHPKFLKNPFYVAGDSYSGKLVPILVQNIAHGIELGYGPPINIQGYILGNPLTDGDINSNAQMTFAYYKSLLSGALYESTKRNCKGKYENVDPKNTLCTSDLDKVNECIDKINRNNILEPKCDIVSLKKIRGSIMWDQRATAKHSSFDILLNVHVPQHSKRSWCRDYNYIPSITWANDKTVRNALHIREGTVDEWLRCNRNLSYTFDVSSTVVYHKNLIKKGYRVLIYSGDLDMVVPNIATETWIKSLNLNVVEDWKPWFVDDQVAGYLTEYRHNKYQLTYATVKGAGHTAPEYKPKECFAMINRWLAYYPLLTSY